jgi:hypothetical protein
MAQIIARQSAEVFSNQRVTARFDQLGVSLSINLLDAPETFLEMSKQRKAVDPEVLTEALMTDGFSLTNLGVSVALEVISPNGERFAVFTRRGKDKKCLALISGYWNTNSDSTPFNCAERELIEEFLVYKKSDHIFLVPTNTPFPYQACAWRYTKLWNLTPRLEALEWVSSAKLQVIGDSSRIYFDSSTSSAQVVYGYCAVFSNWDDLSLFHAEDQLDKDGELVTYIEDDSLILFKLVDNQLSGNPYCLKQGNLIPAHLPQEAYFHPSMVGANQLGVVSSDFILIDKVVRSLQ